MASADLARIPPPAMLCAPVKRRKSWREKLDDDKGLPQVQEITGRLSKRWGTGTVVIPAPREVDALMRVVPPGRLTTVNELRARLAARHNATIACPITTGIFAWIAAHAAAESAADGATETTPYWRTLKADGELNPKYPGGVEDLRRRLESEGHAVVQRGKKLYVDNYDRVLFQEDLASRTNAAG